MLCSHLLVLIDTEGRFSFFLPLDRPHFRRTDWGTFQDCLENRIQSKPELKDYVAVETFVKKITVATLDALAVSILKKSTCEDPVP